MSLLSFKLMTGDPCRDFEDPYISPTKDGDSYRNANFPTVLEVKPSAGLQICPSCGQPVPKFKEADEVPLTRRQKEVLCLLSRGYTAKEIGDFLGISKRTAEFHKIAIQRKLGTHTMVELIRYALMHGLA